MKLTDAQRNEAREESTKTALAQLKSLRKFIKNAEAYIKDESDEGMQMVAVLSAKVLDGFMTQECGYDTWMKECRRQILAKADSNKSPIITH